MEVTKNALEEADNWTKLITDIEIVINNNISFITRKNLLGNVKCIVFS